MVLRCLAVALIFIILTSLVSASAWGAVVYVKKDSPGPVFDGSSWGTAFHMVQEAVNAAQPGDELWIATGTYVENISIVNRMSLYGGFKGTETARDDRDWLRYPTVLDGSKTAPVVECSNMAGYPIRIDGFTIRNGYSTSKGGGINRQGYYYPSYTDLIIAHCTITNNTGGSGGAIRTEQSIQVLDCIIKNNTAAYGGAIHSTQATDVTSCTFTDNTAVYKGGGIFAATQARIKNSTFKNNRAAQGGAICGGSVTELIWGRIEIESCKFSGNSALGYTDQYSTLPARGGAVFAHKATGSPIASNYGFDIRIINSFFSANAAADSGSAVYLQNCGTVIQHNSLAKNGVAGEGSVHLEQCITIFADNIMAFNTSGVKWSGNSLNYNHNCAYQNTAYNISGASPTESYYNISSDPNFADLLTGNLHIQPDSPCKDAGSDTALGGLFPIYSDIDGHTRLVGNHVDIGADESNGLVWDENQVGIVYVSSNGSDLNDGSSWAKAKKTIQAGINEAANQVAEVWVAAGTYNERITLKSNAWLYGGFMGNETAKSQRDWKINKSVIDGTPAQGEQGGSVVTITGVAKGLSCLDGFTVRGGAGTVKPSDANPAVSCKHGGGIFCSGSGVEITNCTITRNKCDVGAGVYCINSDTVISRCKFTDNDVYQSQKNYAYGHGGALYCIGSCTISGNMFSRNIATRGSAIYCSGQAKITFNTIVQNGGYIDSAIYCKEAQPVVISSNIIAFNAAGINVDHGYPTLKDNCVYGNARYNYSNWEGYSLPNSDISLDPRLVSLGYGDHHIQPDSPCINKGDNAFAGTMDIDEQPRIAGERADIGADESDGIVREVNPRIIRVKPSYSNDNNDGSSWQYPKRSIQAAVNALRDTGGEIWVAAGTYFATGSTFGQVSIPSHVKIYGGFKGTETQQTQRNWNTNVTKIVQYGVTYINDSIVKFEPNCKEAVLDGFTISGARITEKNGGIRCSYGSKPLICNNRITGNMVQVATYSGSGIYGEDESYPTIVNNIIYGNSASCGATIYLLCSGEITNNTVASNTGDGVNSYHYTTGDSASCYNNIVAYNTGKSFNIYMSASELPEYDAGYNCVYGNGTDVRFLSDINADPLFVDRANGDYHLRPESPCIDSGHSPSVIRYPFDIDGEPRRVSRVDIGADESPVCVPITAENRLLPVGSAVRFDGIVTYASPYYYAVELPDRSGAIMVRVYGLDIQLHVDDKVELAGTITSDGNYIKSIQASYAAVVGSGHIEPFFIPNRFIGGSEIAYDPVTRSGLPGTKNGIGPNNLYLLVKTAGRVTAREDFSTYSFIYLDDGSGADDFEGKTGIRVSIPLNCAAPVGSYVLVTGIILPRSYNSVIYRQIEARSAEEVFVLQP